MTKSETGYRAPGTGGPPAIIVTTGNDVCEAARQEAYLLMMHHAQTIGAHAVLGMRYDATEFVAGATEVLSYGTAVRLER